jgi:hypothetical protein
MFGHVVGRLIDGTAPFGSSLVAAMSTALAIIKWTKAKPFFADGVDISLFGLHRIIETSSGEVCGGWSMCRLQMCECFRRGVVVDWWLFLRELVVPAPT